MTETKPDQPEADDVEICLRASNPAYPSRSHTPKGRYTSMKLVVRNAEEDQTLRTYQLGTCPSFEDVEDAKEKAHEYLAGLKETQEVRSR
jgi:hypothetical protein